MTAIDSQITTKLESFIKTKLVSDLAPLFDIGKLPSVLELYSDENKADLDRTLDILSPLDVDIVSHLFNFPKGEFDISPDPYIETSPRNTLLPSLLFSIITDSSTLWPVISLNVMDCTLVPSGHLIEFIKKSVHLQELILTGCGQLKDKEMLDLLLTGMTRLTSLGLGYTSLAGDTIVRWVMANADITELDISGNALLGNYHFEQLAKGTPKLREVEISNLEHIEGLALVSFLKTHAAIRKISMDNCSKFRPTNFIQLKAQLQNLEELSLKRESTLLCDFGIILQFIASHPKLAILSLLNWQGNARDLTVNFDNLPIYRDITTAVLLNRKDILFPDKFSSDEITEFLSDIRAAFEEKKILLILEE